MKIRWKLIFFIFSLKTASIDQYKGDTILSGLVLQTLSAELLPAKSIWDGGSVNCRGPPLSIHVLTMWSIPSESQSCVESIAIHWDRKVLNHSCQNFAIYFAKNKWRSLDLNPRPWARLECHEIDALDHHGPESAVILIPCCFLLSGVELRLLDNKAAYLSSHPSAIIHRQNN